MCQGTPGMGWEVGHVDVKVPECQCTSGFWRFIDPLSDLKGVLESGIGVGDGL
jgi:hypothetical protein